MKLIFNKEEASKPLLHYVVKVFLISNLAFILIFISIYFILSKEISEKTFENLVRETLETIKPTAATAAFSSSEAMAALALKPMEGVPWIKSALLKDSFGDTLYTFTNPDNNAGANSLRNKLSYDLFANGKVTGELIVYVDYSQSRNLIIDLTIGTLAIVFSTTLVSLFNYLFIKRKIVRPVEQLAQFVDEPQIAASNLHKNNPGFEKTLAPLEISELTSISRQLEKTVTQLSEQATIDPLTGLANRRAFDIDLEETIRTGDGFTLLLLDIDYFKFINDQYGHSAGDHTLRHFAGYLADLAKRENGGAYRLGGDEFAVILLGDPTGSKDPASNIRTSYSLTYPHLNNLKIYYSISVGLGSYPNDIGNGKELLVQVGSALLAAKKQGRKSIVRFAAELHGADLSVPAREYELAITQDRITHYAQPILCPSTGEILAFEMLLRILPGETGTYVRPDLAVETAIRMGLTDDLTSRTLRAAHQMIETLRKAGNTGTKISINICEAQLFSTEFLSLFEGIFTEEVHRERLIIEVLENDYLKSEKSSRVIYELKARKVEIALDDLGKGFSSLERLFVLPTNIIKLDRCLMKHREHAPELLAGLISALSSNDRTVIVEGVETDEDAQFIRQIGNVFVQGYFYARPMPAETALQWTGKPEPRLAAEG